MSTAADHAGLWNVDVEDDSVEEYSTVGIAELTAASMAVVETGHVGSAVAAVVEVY